MSGRERDEFKGMYARLEDWIARVERGEPICGSFFSPRELHYAERYLDGRGVSYGSFGGYGEAERKKLYLLPDYMGEAVGVPFEAHLAAFGIDTEIAALRIDGSGYRVLSHRDFLGSILGLGIERSVLGDLITDSESGQWAVAFCDGAIALFIENELKKVANDKVRVSLVTEWELPPRRYVTIHDTVASSRLDCVVAALCGMSREKANDTVRGGLVEVDFESEERPDRLVDSCELISIRGYGRFRLLALRDRTKKGRIRLEAEKYL